MVALTGANKLAAMSPIAHDHAFETAAGGELIAVLDPAYDGVRVHLAECVAAAGFIVMRR